MSFVSQELLSPGLVPAADGSGVQVNWCTEVRYIDAPACSAVASYVRTSFLKVSDERQYEPVNWVDSRFERFGYFRLSQDISDRSTGAPELPLKTSRCAKATRGSRVSSIGSTPAVHMGRPKG